MCQAAIYKTKSSANDRRYTKLWEVGSQRPQRIRMISDSAP